MKLVFNDLDDAHEWWLDGRRASGISGLGKVIDESFALDNWRKRMVLVGAAVRPDLVAMAAAHHDDRDLLDKVADQAIEAAKASAGANRGTALHRVAERVDLGEKLEVATPEQVAFADAYRRAVEAAALTVHRQWIECPVVWPDRKWCGRFDRIYGLAAPCPRCGGTLRVGDLKGGENAIKYPRSVRVQLSGYARAPFLAVGNGTLIGPRKWEWRTFEPLPAELCRCTGLVAHAPADGTVSFYEVDLDEGDLQLVAQVKAWQRATAWDRRTNGHAYVRPYGAPVAEVVIPQAPFRELADAFAGLSRVAQTPADVAGTAAKRTAEQLIADENDVSALNRTLVEYVDVTNAVDPLATRRDALRQRIADELDDAERLRLKEALRSSGVPISLAGPELLTKIEDAVAAIVAGRYVAPVAEQGEGRPLPPALPAIEADEGGPADPDAVAALAKVYAALGPAAAWINAVGVEAQRAGRPFHLKGNATVRRFELMRGLVKLAAEYAVSEGDVHQHDESAIARVVLAYVLDSDAPRHPAITVGEAVGTLNHTLAVRFAEAVDALVDGRLLWTVNDQGDDVLVARP